MPRSFDIDPLPNKVKHMTGMTTEHGFELFIKALSGNNFSKETIRAYRSDLTQFIEYLETSRVDWNNPVRISRIDIVEFMNYLNTVARSGTTRARKLASIRHFLGFLKENRVDSTGERNSGCQCISRGAVSECLAGSAVEF